MKYKKEQYSKFSVIPYPSRNTHNIKYNLSFNTGLKDDEFIVVQNLYNADKKYLNEMLVKLNDVTKEAHYR